MLRRAVLRVVGLRPGARLLTSCATSGGVASAPRVLCESLEASAPSGLRSSSTPSVETAAGAASRRFALGVQPALKPSSLRRAALFIGSSLVLGSVVAPTLNIKANCALDEDVGETDEKKPKRQKKHRTAWLQRSTRNHSRSRYARTWRWRLRRRTRSGSSAAGSLEPEAERRRGMQSRSA